MMENPILPTLPENSLETMGARSFVPTLAAGPESSASVSDETLVAPVAAEQAITLGKCFARGGMGEVWTATQNSLGRTVAVKRIRADLMSSGDGPLLEEALRHEGLVAGSLEHPNIVPVHDLVEDRYGRPQIAMKLVQGEPWSAILQRDFEELDAPALLARNLPILASVARAVAFAHSRGVVHRDLKPAQVMIGEFGEVLLMDWGLAVYAGASPSATTARARQVRSLCPISHASNPSGTPSFMAPEQTEPTSRNLGLHTDVYLLGGILYLLLTGSPPHGGSSTTEAIRHAVRGEVPLASERAPGRYIPRELENLCRMALEPAPSQRLESAALFLARLEDFLSGESRRRESEDLTAASEEKLRAAGTVYSALAEVVSDLSRARLLSPGNHEARLLQNKALAQYSQTAARNGDLVLARLQAERMDSGSMRGASLEVVERAEMAHRRQRATRRFAVGGTLMLLLVVLIGGTTLALEIAGESTAAVEARREAATARVHAETLEAEAQNADADSTYLVDFLLSDLRERVSEVDQELRLLDETVRRALEHYRNRVSRAEDVQEHAAIAERLGNLHQMFFLQGNMEDAESTARLAEELLRAAVERHPEDAELQASAAMNQLDLVKLLHARGGELSDEQGLLNREVERLARAQDRITALREGSPPPAEMLKARAELLAYESDLLGRVDPKGAKVASAEALDLAKQYRMARGSNDSMATEFLAYALLSHSSAMSNGGELAEGFAAAEESLALYEEAVNSAPSERRRLHLSLKLGDTLNHVYVLSHQLGGGVGKGELLLRGVGLLRELSMLPATRLRAMPPLCVALQNLTRYYSERGNVPAAWASVQEAIALVEEMVRKDPTNAVRRNMLAQALQEGSNVAQARNDFRLMHEMAFRAYTETDSLCRMRPSYELWRMFRIEQSYRVMCTAYATGQQTLSEEFRDITLRLLDEEIARTDEAGAKQWHDLKEATHVQFNAYYPMSQRPADQ